MMVTDMGMNWTEAGFGFTLLGIACGITSLAPAMLIRQIGVSLTLIVGAILLAAGFGCLAIAHSVLPYHVGTTLMGMGYCFCGTVAGVHVISAMFERKSAALGIYFTSGGIGSVAGPLFFVAIQKLLTDWRIFWVFCAVGALLAGLFAAIVTRGSHPRHAPKDQPVVEATGWTAREALRMPQYWVIVGGYTACLLVNTTVHSFVVQHMSERGITQASAAFIVSAGAAVSAIASAIAGVVGERIHARWLLLCSLSALTIASGSLVLPQSWFSLGLFALSIGIGLGFSYVAAAMLLHDYFGRRPNLELYSTMCMVSTSAAVGPGLGGYVRDHTGSFLSVFATLAIIGFALVVAVLAMRRPVRAADEAEAKLAPEYI
jgi:MFS family permease